MGFLDLISLLREPGDNEIPPSIYDDLTTEYNTVVEGSAASIAEREAANAELVAEITRLKAINFDLLMATGEADKPVTEDIEDVDDEDSAPAIDDLFD